VVFVSNATKKLFEPLAARHNLTVIHNGFDPTRLSLQVAGMTRESARKQLDIGEKEIAILMVGTVCERKNQIELINALKLLPNDILKNVKVLIVGDRPSPYSEAMHNNIAGLPSDLAERITLVPETGEVGRFYLAADIFIMTSKLESFPVVIQEAMYFGLPILAQPSFGIREQVVNESTALFYTLGDNNNLAEMVNRLITSESLRGRLGANAKISLNKLPSNKFMVTKYCQLIKEAWVFGRPRLKIYFDSLGDVLP
jgi:glycosyltransferase involved in cell wall biosynthesis